MSERGWMRLGVAVAILLFVFLPVRGEGGLGIWTVTLALAAVIGTVGLVGAIILWRSPPMPPEPPPGPVEPPPPSDPAPSER